MVAAFDFDGTLTRGGSTFAFLTRIAGWRAVSVAVVRTLPRLLHAALVGGEAADRAKESLFVRLLGGRPESGVAESAARFGRRHLQRHVRPDVARLVQRHQEQGHTVLVVSASPEYYVGPAVRLLGVDAVLATRLAVVDGVLTGRFAGRNCRGGEKYRRVAEWLEEAGAAPEEPAPELWAYGNSRGDLRLLAAADRGFDVGRLGRLGRLRHYPRVAPGSPPGVPSGSRPGA